MTDQLSCPSLHPGETAEERRAVRELAAAIRQYLMDDNIPFLDWRRAEDVDEEPQPSTPTWNPALASLSRQSHEQERERKDTTLGSQSDLSDVKAVGVPDHLSLIAQAQEVYLRAVAWAPDRDEEILGRAVADAHSVVRRLGLTEEDDLHSRIFKGDSFYLPTGAAFFMASTLAICGRIAADSALLDGAVRLYLRVWDRGRVGASGGLCEGFERDWRPLEGFCGPACYLDGMEACSSLLAATGDGTWRKRWLEIALLFVAGFYAPATGLLQEGFMLNGPAEVEGIYMLPGTVCSPRAAWVLLRSAVVLEEPGFADVGRHLLDTTLGKGIGTANDSTLPSVQWERMGKVDLGDLLAALAGYYRLRPSREKLNQMGTVWAAISGSVPETLDMSDNKHDGGEWITELETSCRLMRACLVAVADLNGLEFEGV